MPYSANLSSDVTTGASLRSAEGPTRSPARAGYTYPIVSPDPVPFLGGEVLGGIVVNLDSRQHGMRLAGSPPIAGHLRESNAVLVPIQKNAEPS
jgi:hypothetical protein